MTDISAEPYCFVNLGGVKIDMGIERGYKRNKAASGETAKVYVHYYVYPLLLMLRV